MKKRRVVSLALALIMAFGLMGTSTVSAEITYLWGVDYIA